MDIIKKFRFEPLSDGSIFGKVYLDDQYIPNVIGYELKSESGELPTVTIHVAGVPSKAIYPCLADVREVPITAEELERVIDEGIEKGYLTRESVARRLAKYMTE